MSAGFTPVYPYDHFGQANSRWWSDNADDYLGEFGSILGETDFIWGPEGLREQNVELLGTPESLTNSSILEIGAGAAQCSRYLALKGLDVTASDIAPGMVDAALSLNAKHEVSFPVDMADARNLPYDDGRFDVVFTSFGAIDFISELRELHCEIRRVLKPLGRWIFSCSHPVKWIFADNPNSFEVFHSYFDRTPYLERRSDGELEYAHFHHTLADHVNALTDAGFHIEECIEPEWPADRKVVWGAWGPIRSAKVPGTIIFGCRS
ncbi:SAM-dependent methyltransferase [Trueperella bonasi]|uniref:SAM-dependent methyltransferase n=1 Tax=Trueperella bonasi TaxID=312286 RepID=A0ABT9NDP3_9ACTO|nr:class I SAM-dependent methyltransferase [Trueperella bonasi]MDP9805501.1 SAM-dependent methyltransferase [Trueperella bonasi]